MEVDDLLRMLDEAYPERCPDPKASDRDIWIAVGQRQVVRFLLSLQAERDAENAE
jgi:hypothetical protein